MSERVWAFEVRGDGLVGNEHYGFRSQDDEGEFVCFACDAVYAAEIIVQREDRLARLDALADLARRAPELVRFATDIPSREAEALAWLRDYEEADNSNVNVKLPEIG